MYFCRDMDQAEIAEELGVTQGTVSKYINSEPSQEVQEMIDWRASQVRLTAMEELRQQLKEAGERSRTAEKPVKIYENENGELEVDDVEIDDGYTKKIPVVQDMELLPDQETRYYARKEAREILDQMAELVGAKEADQVELTGEGGGGIIINMDDGENGDE